MRMIRQYFDILALITVLMALTVLAAYYIYYFSHIPYDIDIDAGPTDTESLKRYEESLNRFLAAQRLDV